LLKDGASEISLGHTISNRSDKRGSVLMGWLHGHGSIEFTTGTEAGTLI